MYTYRIPKIVKAAYPSVTWSKPKSEGKVYFTFDDGPHPESTPAILEMLDQFGVKATFFCVGDNVQKYPKLYQEIIDKGHAVGNHTFNHLNGMKTPKTEYLSNVEKAAEVIDSKLFRPPYGKMKMNQLSQLKKKYQVVMWTLLIGDFDPSLTKEQCFFVLKNKMKAGDIIVLHDNIKAFDKMIFTLEKGLELAQQKKLELAIL